MIDINRGGKRSKVIGVGSALVDILIRENDAFLAQNGAVKGAMIYADSAFIEQVLSRTSAIPKVVPGGSACNTMVGIGRLGGAACFIGKCGRDELGRLLQQRLEKQQVTPWLVSSDIPTGRVLSIITPDAQRSMLTFLGASAHTSVEDIAQHHLANAAIVHIEGYLLFNRHLLESVMTRAKAAGALVSLDLASANVVEQSKEILYELVDRHVDILIANEDEALAYTDIDDEERSVRAMARQASVAVLKTGPRGSLIAQQDKVFAVKPRDDGRRAIDTTGAGDLWAAGFLFGMVQGWPIEQCGELGSVCGFEVCQVVGASIPDEGWKTIHQFMEEKWPKKE